jgi:hypothetical protein
MKYTFVIIENFIPENRLYFESKVNYEKLFNELDNDTIFALDKLTFYYYNFFKIKMKYMESSTISIEPVKNIDDIPVKIQFFLIKNITDYITRNYYSKIGINITISYRESINPQLYYMLQNFSTSKFNIENDEDFKNIIYNCLFYCHIITKYFKYSPILKYLNHEDDINELNDIQKSIIHLYGNKIECSICLEQTISSTICNHPLCQKCFSKMNKKNCPLCRKPLIDELMDYDEDDEE